MDKNYQQPPPSYPGYNPQPTVTQTYVVTNQTTTPVGPTGTRVICPSCRADIITTLKHEPTTKTHLMALCLFCFICSPCLCLPCCMDSCQNANHYCPNCNAFIGTYQS